MRRFTKLCFLVMLAALCLVDTTQAVITGQVNIVLLGATGDLARKYLWQSLFTLFLNAAKDTPNVNLQIIGASRDAETAGTEKVNKMLADNLNCYVPDVAWKVSKEECFTYKLKFDTVKKYMQVKSDADWKALASSLASTTTQEIGRLFYLSVPPFAYEGLAESINKFGRPDSNSWLRVVLEKPFGSDLESAKGLAATLAKHLKEEEMYRVDHYLGKPGVMAIETFRYANRKNFEPLWNNKYIDRVDIVMKETEDVKGRTGFYDSYGVIRDVHQNHLTQIMILVGMELASGDRADDPTYVQQLKDNVLKDARVLQGPSVVTGQYSNYTQHVQTDNPKQTTTVTATWAAVAAFIDNQRWSGVPFVMMGGKDLDERAAYVRVHFKDNYICIKQCLARQVLFMIQGGHLKNPAIVVSKSLPSIENFETIGPLPDALLTTHNGGFIPLGDAYTKLVAAVYYGTRDRFVSTENLLRSWEVWTPLLLSVGKPRQYNSGGEGLDVVVEGSAIRFADAAAVNSGQCDGKGPQFRGSRQFTGPSTSLIASLAQEMADAAIKSIKARGVFHMAVSGGSSPNLLFQYLAFYKHDFPWSQTHIWQVDERCVAVTDSNSNFAALQSFLLDTIRVPHINVHPMPVDMQSGLCASSDKGAEYYSKQLKIVPGEKLNFVLLGIGEDGHTASLFPGVTVDSKQTVALTTAPASTGVVHRMTLTLPYINNADQIAVLVVGSRKKEIVKKLRDAEVSTQLPITGVRKAGTTWYIDADAL